MPEPKPRPRAAAALAPTLALALAFASGTARAQDGPVPPPRVPDLAERSGLVMRFADVPGRLPPDPYRDNFYGTRYADRGAVNHLRINPKDQGLYGLGMKSQSESVYPFFYGNPGASNVTAATKPWPRPLRALQGMVDPYRPVGMYYSYGSYVPIHDADPLVPGPGPYPYPFYFNWGHGG